MAQLLLDHGLYLGAQPFRLRRLLVGTGGMRRGDLCAQHQFPDLYRH